ncbi:deoxyribodipyrimidine photo-lyase [Corynebacterium renale]|uniref:Deoxyribodipyrimidine photo-lyase n=1 Tax=Corynebacterium renale TaxID=1724 RepID=A0A2A9DKB2_9CORY|nr:deoxyribodipyrimidine photo-lyase [Corynebacterium renale]PFG27148.1 deoxyribodipyrimidine photo-lyase [Corynebacterium renale]SQG64121.1 deoxyribodipyrimidine photo-lyase [Corynebacterium renale]SQI24019.1 deoxyribodipyrimidine photo-lyase [Corynebacterium renale]STC94371.1 deoxyribodipyrimidine photo-lyase [Corynebacterium renale]
MTTLLWFRDDLRVTDHAALTAALHDGPTVAVWIRESVGPRPLGAAVRWWYHRSLEELRHSLADLGVPLVFAAGDARSVVPELAARLGATTVRWSRRYAPAARAIDAEVKQTLREAGVSAHSHAGSLLVEPFEVAPAGKEFYQVFTPFYRAASERGFSDPLPAPGPLPEDARATAESPLTLEELGLLAPGPAWWEETVEKHWQPGETAGLAHVTDTAWVPGYATDRDLPGAPDGTSKLSPYLRSGNLSPAYVAVAVSAHSGEDADSWIRQLYWREFCWHIYYHHPALATRPLRTQFELFPYQPDPDVVRAWQRAETGIDFVDAGMAQLWHTGWMHGRVRMSAASLLTKNLLQPWQDGEQWFWNTLVDADEATNPFSWQWVAGCGADAAPYFRIFNPELQQKKFDPTSAYTSHWLKVRGGLPSAPIVDLKESRREALAAYEVVKSGPL